MIVVELVSFKDKFVIDRIDVNDLKKKVTCIYLVKRKLFDGAFPLVTDHLSHWAVALLTNDNMCFIIGTQFRHITELKLSRLDYPFVYPSTDKYPFYIVKKYECKNKNLTVKDYLEYMTVVYANKEYGYFNYNCQAAVVDVLKRFSPDADINSITGLNLVTETIHELMNYEKYKLY